MCATSRYQKGIQYDNMIKCVSTTHPALSFCVCVCMQCSTQKSTACVRKTHLKCSPTDSLENSPTRMSIRMPSSPAARNTGMVGSCCFLALLGDPVPAGADDDEEDDDDDDNDDDVNGVGLVPLSGASRRG